MVTAVSHGGDHRKYFATDDLVLAHQHAENPRERFGRLIRRHHTWAVSSAIFFAAFTVLATLAVLLINRSRQLELAAKNEAKGFKTEAIGRYRESRSAINTWLVGSNEALQFYPGTQSIRKRMLQLASEDYKRLSASSRDPDLELERARALHRYVSPTAPNRLSLSCCCPC